VRVYEKRDHIAHFQNFHFKTLITWKVYSSYRLQLGCDDFPLYLQGIPCHAHFRFGRGECASWSCSKITIFASLWQFTVWYRRLTLAYNIGSVKQKA